MMSFILFLNTLSVPSHLIINQGAPCNIKLAVQRVCDILIPAQKYEFSRKSNGGGFVTPNTSIQICSYCLLIQAASFTLTITCAAIFFIDQARAVIIY